MIDLKKICQVLESKSCKEHREKPKASVSGSSIKFSCCCNKFEKELEKVIESELANQTEEALKKLFK